MSGTSLDGLDLAQVAFRRAKTDDRWQFELLSCKTIEYPKSLKAALGHVIDASTDKIEALDHQLGVFIGESIKKFESGLTKNTYFIASHGHTVFHQPQIGITRQIGSANSIHEITGLPVINDFRTADVQAGGQGAPLVPIGDRDLFADYDMALNLGGIANISFNQNQVRIAFDICPFNMALNELSKSLGYDFDENGEIARKGNIDSALLHQLESINYLKKSHPKSLGLEDYRSDWRTILLASNAKAEDKLTTYIKHSANQVAEIINKHEGRKVLITGGGAYNSYFIECLKRQTKAIISVPNANIIEFKEALIFAYLGLLRLEGKANCLSSVTGATHDVSGGALFGF